MQKRVLIVDFNHIAYSSFHSGYRLSKTVVVNGIPMEKDTTIHNTAIKNIHRWSKGGIYPTAVCFDRKVASRKAFWQLAFPEMVVGSGKEYKGNREKMPEAMFEAISDCENLLRQAGVSCYSRVNYEADDLIFACVQRAKELYPDCPIDIVSNDVDLLPLVDEQVSVFLRSRKLTWAESPDLEKAHYVQVTPENFQGIVEDLSAFKGFLIPYNSILLHKILRGDSSDNYKRKEISKMFPKSKYNQMILNMLNDGVNFADIFRYSKPKYEIYNSVTGEAFQGTMQEALASPEKPYLKKRIKNSDELDCIIMALQEYSTLSEEQLEVVKNIYLGMNLNQPYVSTEKALTRHEFKVTEKDDIKDFSEIELQKVINPLGIRLKMI